MYIVECFWYRDSEITAFKTYEEAFKYMKEDFIDTIHSYDFIITNENKVIDDEGRDISDLTWLSEKKAQIDGFGIDYEDKLTWKIVEIQ